ncbi:lysozyme inhibitor LprI family protein [Pseudanabaena yagii]|uniref:DUF1311 domain-containing protein n=1 Tax=Pseudanabaena yagii GIHE-NHR1 TaxID=2722753 RepID=A0ABX1LX08_9CYAN|nr:lysozyme inhibitor LprI family protein [Pseudanabaena yagii]NMF60006.1 DUF1311 domain-containing protein [Pseudanabaena yagii GIHE-NHR1]
MNTILNSLSNSLTLAFGLSCLAIAPVAAETIAQSQIFGVAAPACESQTQIGLNICASRWAKTTNFLRSLIYEEVSSQQSEAGRTQLKVIEKTWTSYRDNHCQEVSEPFREGSIYPLLYLSCLARVTNDRIADLQGTNNPKLTPDATAQRLAKILNQGNLKNSAGQRQWLQYQAQHCQFESLRFTERSQVVKQCRDRLAESRLRELEALVRIR